MSSIDWWSLGVLQYELLYGKRPFRASTNDDLQKAILNDQPKIPHPFSSSASSPNGSYDSGETPHLTLDCIASIKEFLDKDIHKRLGTIESGGMDRLKLHAWFKGLDWDKIEKKEWVALWVPDVSQAHPSFPPLPLYIKYLLYISFFKNFFTKKKYYFIEKKVEQAEFRCYARA